MTCSFYILHRNPPPFVTMKKDRQWTTTIFFLFFFFLINLHGLSWTFPDYCFEISPILYVGTLVCYYRLCRAMIRPTINNITLMVDDDKYKRRLEQKLPRLNRFIDRMTKCLNDCHHCSVLVHVITQGPTSNDVKLEKKNVRKENTRNLRMSSSSPRHNIADSSEFFILLVTRAVRL